MVGSKEPTICLMSSKPFQSDLVEHSMPSDAVDLGKMWTSQL